MENFATLPLLKLLLMPNLPLSDADRAFIKREIHMLRIASTAKHFKAEIQMEGETEKGSKYYYRFIVDECNSEFIDMLNAIASRRSKQLL